jgi:hypothetical protein
VSEIPQLEPSLITSKAITPHLEPRSTHQGNGRGKDDDDNPTRAMAVVAMKMAGASFASIAGELGYASAGRAQNVYERALAASVDMDTDLTRARTLQVKRLDRLLMSVWEKAINPKHRDHILYASTALKIIDRTSKLQGLDAPVQVNMTHSASYEDIERWASKMASIASPDEIVVEADIFDEQDAPWESPTTP